MPIMSLRGCVGVRCSPYYGFDGQTAWRVGADRVVGLIGPGVDASHSYERTHRDALEANMGLIVEYLPS